VIFGLLAWNILSTSNKSRKLAKLEKSIAVLPFENWNSDSEYAHMGDAIANEINTQLAKIKEFHIFSYTSSLVSGKNSIAFFETFGISGL
jgi:TolB-like protein